VGRAAAETVVRMGELSVSRTPGHALAGIGLGSCIGLVFVASFEPVVGLAHIVLPHSKGISDGSIGKFADRAVPALLEEMTASGVAHPNLEVVLVGGARMFSMDSGSTLDIGRRNEQAAREALISAGLPIRAAATGGNQGRTVRVYVDSGRVTVKEPGAPETELFATERAGAVK